MGAGHKKTLELRQGGAWCEALSKGIGCVEIRGEKNRTFKEVILGVNLP